MSISASYPTLRPTLLLDFANSGRLDPRVTFTRASTATYFDETGVLQSAAINTPRFDYDPSTLAAQGFLIEEARTNSIRNNTMQGAVAGTPGTLPTNWVQSALASGLTANVLGTGTSSGINYIDIHISGTTADTTGWSVFTDANTQIAASSGQVWTGSSYVAIIGGSTANIASGLVRVVERNSGGSYIGESNTSWGTATSVLTNNRFSVVRTLGGTAAFVQFGVYFQANSGVAIDITLRIGLPQLELGAFATSVIPTTTTALTRSADVASVNTLSPWFNATEGTVYVDFAGRQAGSQPYMTMLSNTGETERIYQRYASAQYQTFARVANVDIANVYNSAEGSAVNAKIASTYDASQLATSTNGQAVTGSAVASLSSVPSGLNKLWLGSFAGSSAFANGYLRRVSYYPRALSSAELQAITA